ncbi:MAG TPA: tetraacyldisaccharide 4'-kinase [Acidimicrobiaceae bacterium]|nr:tetraacyldisaccharide 4'-kinase [Acidimicrobiaceae bacterium]|tara:strand:+ start:277 stop:486 length:210 start_codon:yes stop_codon:yes gene_type:complete
MSLDPQLLEILVCPEDKGVLVYVESEGVLLNDRLLRTYPVRDNIPVMLIDEASQISKDEVQRLLAIAAG